MSSRLILPLGFAAALASAPTAAADAVPQPEFHRLAGASQLKRGESLKPVAGAVALPPIVLETRVHYHADGRVTHECHQSHARQADAGVERSATERSR